MILQTRIGDVQIFQLEAQNGDYTNRKEVLEYTLGKHDDFLDDDHASDQQLGVCCNWKTLHIERIFLAACQQAIDSPQAASHTKISNGTPIGAQYAPKPVCDTLAYCLFACFPHQLGFSPIADYNSVDQRSCIPCRAVGSHKDDQRNNGGPDKTNPLLFLLDTSDIVLALLSPSKIGRGNVLGTAPNLTSGATQGYQTLYHKSQQKARKIAFQRSIR